MNYQELVDQENLFQTDIAGNSYVWRLLTMREYRKFKALQFGMHKFIFFNLIFERCFIGNVASLNGNIPGGVSISIGELIFWYSGESQNTSFVNDIANLRNNSSDKSIDGYMRKIIFTVWPSLKPMDLDDLTYLEFMKYFTEAESILKFRNPEYVPLDLRKIVDANNPNPKRKGIASGDNLVKDNQELRKALGNEVHPLDMAPDELSDLEKRSKGLSKRSIAAKLDQRNRRK